MFEHQLDRIQSKIRFRQLRMNAVLSEAEVVAFERSHAITLPEAFRAFLLRIGNGGVGPPTYGLVRLGEAPNDIGEEGHLFWTQLPRIREPFPFTQPWVWENGEVSTEGVEADIDSGCLMLGEDGCGMFWHLPVHGADRGIPWLVCDEGMQPVAPKRDFLQWYEDWLDGKDSFYGFDATLTASAG